MSDGTIDPEFARQLVAAFDGAAYSRLLGMRVRELRRNHVVLELPYRPELDQPAGFVHGGAMASLIDTASALAIFSGLDQLPQRIATIDLHVHYLGAVRGEDLVAVTRVRQRGRSIVFLTSEVTTPEGRAVAHGEASFRVIL